MTFSDHGCRTNLVYHFIATVDMVVQFVTGCRHTPLSRGSICVGCGRLGLEERMWLPTYIELRFGAFVDKDNTKPQPTSPVATSSRAWAMSVSMDCGVKSEKGPQQKEVRRGRPCDCKPANPAKRHRTHRLARRVNQTRRSPAQQTFSSQWSVPVL